MLGSARIRPPRRRGAVRLARRISRPAGAKRGQAGDERNQVFARACKPTRRGVKFVGCCGAASGLRGACDTALFARYFLPDVSPASRGIVVAARCAQREAGIETYEKMRHFWLIGQSRSIRFSANARQHIAARCV